MGVAHARELYLHGHTPLHRAAPECKLLAGLLLVLGIVATPREAVWAFGLHALAVGALVAWAGVPAGTALRRALVVLPVVAFALLLPLLTPDGWWAAWNILAKATLGVGVSIVLTATTTVSDLIRGLERLRVPAPLVAITTFMVRYLDVVLSDLHRMQVARRSRGDDPRWLWQARGVVATAGSLFVRCYERGERVHLAMLSRGYDGTLHHGPGAPAATPRAWAATLWLPAAAAVVAATAWAT